ncbi:RNA-directed DNA polymerase, eukaryota, nucleotide-binding alpha-beta plait domain protein [Tanacetum coccineum]
MGFRFQNSLQSKIDQTSKISKSVFISNFPDDCSSRDLWKVCNGYGTVVDVFIPNKRSKAGKRFAFVRFINVLNLDRLIENLKTIWIGRFHLSANTARFERPKASTFQKEKQGVLSPKTKLEEEQDFDNFGWLHQRIFKLKGRRQEFLMHDTLDALPPLRNIQLQIDLSRKTTLLVSISNEVLGFDSIKELCASDEDFGNIWMELKIKQHRDCDDGSRPKEQHLVVPCFEGKIVKFPTQHATTEIRGDNDIILRIL